MKRLLLIRGDLAAGKSTFASILSKRYNIPFFSKDMIKEILGDTIGFSNRQENLKLSNAAIELMQFIFSGYTELNKDLILESNFHREELERLYQLAHEKDYEVLTLDIRGDVSILHKRYLNRIYNENRHPVHLSIKLESFEDFKKHIEYARREEVPEPVVCIDAIDFSYQKDEVLLTRIDKFMGIQ